MIFTIIVVALFVFKAPGYEGFCIPICLAWFGLKALFKRALVSEKFDIFDIWQDNQGL